MLFLLLRGEGAFYLTCNVYCLNNIERGLKERCSYFILFMLKISVSDRSFPGSRKVLYNAVCVG